MPKKKVTMDGKCFSCSNFKKRMYGNAEALDLCGKCIDKLRATEPPPSRGYMPYGTTGVMG